MDIVKVAEEKAKQALRQMELAGAKETLTPQWPIVKAGFISGFKNGVSLGFKMGFTARDFEDKQSAEPDPNQIPLPIPETTGDLL